MKVNRDVLQVFLTIPKTEREDFPEIKKKTLDEVYYSPHKG